MSRTKTTKPDKFINNVPHKECCLCYTYKPKTEFYKLKNNSYYSYCKICQRRVVKKRKKGNTDDKRTTK